MVMNEMIVIDLSKLHSIDLDYAVFDGILHDSSCSLIMRSMNEIE